MEWIGDIERAFAAAIYPNRIGVAILLGVVATGLLVVARRRRWGDAARRHPGALAAVLIPALALALPLGWYLASPLVLSKTIDEPAPIVAVAPSPTAAPSAAPIASRPSRPAPTASPTPSPSPSPFARSGQFAGADDFHFGRGTATLLETSPGAFFVRLAAFEVRNGPDLYVYLSPSADGYAKGSVELGPLKADKGNQNYAVPAGIDPTSARSVVIWCKQFSVLFATAPISPE